jgi:hypothetical protein
MASLVAAVFLPAPLYAGGDDGRVEWRPVTPEELQMKAPKVEADADAEAIFWEVRVDDKKESRLSYDHYVRVKIFTERGREKFSKFDIPFTKGETVENVAARVIKPDGSTVELAPGDIFEREIIKAGKIKVMAKSFAVPGIAPGVIIEYQYKEVFKDTWANGIRLSFQRDIPMQKAVYYIRPQKGFSMAFNYYNTPDTTVFTEDPENKDFYVARMENVPAFKAEPYMPPEDEVRRWAYASYKTFSSSIVWTELSYGFELLLKDQIGSPSKAMKQKAAELVANAATDEDKLRRIYDYAQKQIKNVSFDRAYTPEQRQKIYDDDAEDAMKKGIGGPMQIDLLFGSLAYVSGYEVGIVLSGDRSENFFNRMRYPFRSFVHPACMAVRVGGKWKMFNPGTPYLPYGRLLWHEEAVSAMLVGKGHVWIDIPLTEPAGSLVRRSGKLKLSEDGTLEGNVKLEYNGHPAILRRRDEYDASAAKREDSLKDDIKSRMSSAEITNVSVENFDDNSKPLTYSFNIRVPDYAQKTGKRLFLQPGFFEYGIKPAFSSSTRVNSISFPYSWSEFDDIQFQLPAGYELENAEAPGEVMDQGKIGDLKIAMSYNKAAGTLAYRRNFYFGAQESVLFPPEAYNALKGLFDNFHKADSHVITLKQNLVN